MIQFVVAGVPAPQGSKTRTKWGMREDNPSTRPWREAVSWGATEAMQGKEPLVGPLRLDVVFTFPRPQSHFRSGKHAGELKDSAPVYCAKKPDIDKLCRAIGDAMTGIVYRDDAQVVELDATKDFGTPQAHIMVTQLTL